MNPTRLMAAVLLAALFSSVSVASGAERGPSAEAPDASAPVFDAALATEHGADERGMRRYVLVILKTGPNRVPDGEARTAMFEGHMANINRLAKEGKLAVAGPFMKDEAGWRGLFIFAVESVEEAKSLTETDPVIVNGEMVAEYHAWYGSAALMATSGLHERLVPPPAP